MRPTRGLRRGRRLAPLRCTGDDHFLAQMWPTVVRALDFVLAPAAEPGGEFLWSRTTPARPELARARHRLRVDAPGVSRRSGAGRRLDSAAARLELAAGTAARAALSPGRFRGQDRFSMTGTTRSSVCVAWRRGAGAGSRAVARVRRAGSRCALRRGPPVGDRRRDLRALALATRHPRRALSSPSRWAPRCSTCATTTAPTGRATSSTTTRGGRGALHLDRGRRDPRRRRPRRAAARRRASFRADDLPLGVEVASLRARRAVHPPTAADAACDPHRRR